VRINFKLLCIFIILFLATCTPDITNKTANRKKQPVKTNAIAKLKTQAGGQGGVKVTTPARTTMPKPVAKAKLQEKTVVKNNGIAGISILKKDKLKVQTTTPEANVNTSVPKSNVKTTVPETNVKNIFPESNVKTSVPEMNVKTTVPETNVKNIFPESSEYSTSLKTNNLKTKAISPINQGDSSKIAVHDTAGSSTTTSVVVVNTVDTSSTRPDTKPVTANPDKIITTTEDPSLKPDALLVRGNTFERALKMKMDSLANASLTEFKKPSKIMPNDAMQSVMTPSGFGGSGAYLFGGIGGVYPAVYTTKPDGVGSIGGCVDLFKTGINFAASLNTGSIHRLSDFSTNVIVSKRIFTGSSISGGGLGLFASSIVSDAPAPTFYFAFSHAIQTIPSKTNGYSALTYTIGIGNGRFLQKSPNDIAAGKGKYGTAVFGDISYEIMRRVNLNAEWTGMNLGISTGIRPLAGSPFSIGIGVADLTRYSSDKPSMIFSMGYPLSIPSLINGFKK